MARSAEALKRRAAKRNRTEEEQKKADAIDERKRMERVMAREGGGSTNDAAASTRNLSYTPSPPTATSTAGTATPNMITGTTEPLSRAGPNELKTNKKKKAHSNDPAQKWAKQAGPEQIAENLELRRRYGETNGVGMRDEEVARARILIARDERKRLKRADRKKWVQKKKKKANINLKQKEVSGEANAAHLAKRRRVAGESEPIADDSSSLVPPQPEVLPLVLPISETDVAPSTAPPRRVGLQTHMDQARKHVAIDKAKACLPPFVTEADAKNKTECVGEKNCKEKEEQARIGTFFDEDVVARLETKDRCASSSVDRLSPSNGIRSVSNEVELIKPKVVGKLMKKALKGVPGHSMELKRLRKTIQTMLPVQKHNKKELKKAIKARIEEKGLKFKLNGKLVSLA